MVVGYKYNAWGKFDNFYDAVGFVYGPTWTQTGNIFLHWGPEGALPATASSINHKTYHQLTGPPDELVAPHIPIAPVQLAVIEEPVNAPDNVVADNDPLENQQGEGVAPVPVGIIVNVGEVEEQQDEVEFVILNN